MKHPALGTPVTNVGVLTSSNGRLGGPGSSAELWLSRGSSGGAEPTSAFSARPETYRRIFGSGITKKLWDCKRAMVHLSIKDKQAHLFSFN